LGKGRNLRVQTAANLRKPLSPQLQLNKSVGNVAKFYQNHA